MRVLLAGGVAGALLFISPAAFAETSHNDLTAPASPHARASFFAADQKRGDVAAHIQRLFNGLDLNHDGFVTRDEIANSKARFEERLSKSAPKRAAKAFARLDSNHDGEITEADIEAARAARPGATGKQASGKRRAASSLFLRADANRDGVVTRAEYDAALVSGKIKAHHANMRGSAIVRLFDAADVNRDGRLSLEEAQQAALQHFDAADLNHDGILTPQERRQAASAQRLKHRAA